MTREQRNLLEAIRDRLAELDSIPAELTGREYWRTESDRERSMRAFGRAMDDVKLLVDDVERELASAMDALRRKRCPTSA